MVINYNTHLDGNYIYFFKFLLQTVLLKLKTYNTIHLSSVSLLTSTQTLGIYMYNSIRIMYFNYA